ncbi:uncharacterized protein L201_003534 [Kwoniella dendrophila CBS 6074]|uniref:Extracellular mutant protein 11 C-terminal domain-containing protein n=1 Tax=Kwoniella dendrophila CBS 6074 TaxID=1295534 RepID=A0AAX4JT58_9TREE
MIGTNKSKDTNQGALVPSSKQGSTQGIPAQGQSQALSRPPSRPTDPRVTSKQVHQQHFNSGTAQHRSATPQEQPKNTEKGNTHSSQAKVANSSHNQGMTGDQRAESSNSQAIEKQDFAAQQAGPSAQFQASKPQLSKSTTMIPNSGFAFPLNQDKENHKTLDGNRMKQSPDLANKDTMPSPKIQDVKSSIKQELAIDAKQRNEANIGKQALYGPAPGITRGDFQDQTTELYDVMAPDVDNFEDPYELEKSHAQEPQVKPKGMQSSSHLIAQTNLIPNMPQNQSFGYGPQDDYPPNHQGNGIKAHNQDARYHSSTDRGQPGFSVSNLRNTSHHFGNTIRETARGAQPSSRSANRQNYSATALYNGSYLPDSQYDAFGDEQDEYMDYTDRRERVGGYPVTPHKRGSHRREPDMENSFNFTPSANGSRRIEEVMDEYQPEFEDEPEPEPVPEPEPRFKIPFALLDHQSIISVSIDREKIFEDVVKLTEVSGFSPTWESVKNHHHQLSNNLNLTAAHFQNIEKGLNKLIAIKNTELKRKRYLTERYADAGSDLSNQCTTMQLSTRTTMKRRKTDGWVE